MRHVPFGPVLLSAVVLTGCVSTNAALLDPTVKYQKICPDGVQLFTSAQRVSGDYREVALLHSKGESSWTDERGMVASQRKKAAELGANGIIIGETKEPNAGTKIIGSLLGTGSERKGAALAIYVPGDSLRVQRACATGQTAQLGADTGRRIVETMGGSQSSSPSSSTVEATPASLIETTPREASSRPVDPIQPEAPDSTAIYSALGAVAPAVTEADLSRNPALAQAMSEAQTLGIAIEFFEGRPGILKVAVGEGFRSVQSPEYTLNRLWQAYRGHRPFDEPGILEMWDGDQKVGEYTENGLALDQKYTMTR